MMAPDSAIEDLIAEPYEILEPHAAYLNQGDDGPTRYFLGLGVLEALAFVAVSVVVPIATDLASSAIWDRFKRRTSEGDDPRDAYAEALRELEGRHAALEEEVRALLGRSPSIDQQRADDARTTLEDILVLNGLPGQDAKQDAEDIVNRLLGHVERS